MRCARWPLVDLLQDCFCAAYIPGKNIMVDEGLVKFNSRLAFKQYVPLNPDKFGIKVWLLADADTYFGPQYQIYLGKNRNRNCSDVKGLGYYVVWPYLDANMHLFFDYYFSSVDQRKSLELRDMYAWGTVHTICKGFPAKLKNKLVWGEGPIKMEILSPIRGQIRDEAILTTNTSPASEIFVERQQVGGQLKHVVPTKWWWSLESLKFIIREWME